MPNITPEQLLVLLVEPSATQQRIIGQHLNQLGVMSIDNVRTGHDALTKLSDEKYDLVISAMHLDDMTGTELVQNMRMHDGIRDLPFMLISSETDFRYLEPIRQAGVIAILPKPYELDQLKRALYSTIHYLDPDSLDESGIEPEALNVLVVDDSFTARQHISRVLNNLGIERITTAKNGREAVDIINQSYLDLIVTDYNMPQMDGRQLVEYIRQHSQQASIPVLMVSSESDENRIAAVQQAGVSAICDKPFETDTVRRLLVNLLSS